MKRMRCASKRGKPAVKPLAEDLVKEFAPDIFHHRVRQMIGHMTRQVMEANGYVLDRTRGYISNPVLFKTGATYRHKGQGQERKA